MKTIKIAFLLLFATTLNAQTPVPGGVKNKDIKVWLKANGIVEKDSNNRVTKWKDNSGGNRDYYAPAPDKGKTPLFLRSVPIMNFNPSIFFNNKQDVTDYKNEKTEYLIINSGPMSSASPMNHTSFAVYYAESDAFKKDEVYTHGFGASDKPDGGTRFPSIGLHFEDDRNSAIGSGKVRNSGSGTSNLVGNRYLFKPFSTMIQVTHTTTGNASFYFNGTKETVRGDNNFGTKFRMNQGGTIGGVSSPTRSFIGNIAELIIYESELSEAEIIKVQTYLALKYGVTLSTNYVLSNGVFDDVWPTLNPIYNPYSHNVAGIARDDISGLLQKQSRSSETGSIITMALNEIKEELGQVVGDFQQDKSALVWGDNGKTTLTSTILDACTPNGNEIGLKMDREWLVKNTGESKTVQISPYTNPSDTQASAAFPFNTNYDIYLLVKNSPYSIPANDHKIKGEWKNGKVLFNYTFPANSTRYFTFIGKYNGPPCISCESYGTKRIEFTKTTWPKGQTTQNYKLNDLNVTIITSIEAPSVWKTSKYPRASSKKTLKEYRKRGDGSKVMRTHIKLDKAAKASFELFDIDRTSKRTDDILIYGTTCSGQTILPTLSYYTSAVKSSYTINSNNAKAKWKTSGYTSKKGRMFVVFDQAVGSIYIDHKYQGDAGSGVKNLGIGPIDFTCPTPLPPPSEDGIILIKQAPSNVSTCEDINYVFEIRNVSCNPYKLNFSDDLPNNLEWVEESLSIDQNLIQSNTTFNDYKNTRNLAVNNIEIPGGGKPYYIRAQAKFSDTAQSGIYLNRAKVIYNSNKTVISCDKNSIGCVPTATEAIQGTRYKDIEANLTFNKSCFTENQEIDVTLSLNNPNLSALNNLILNFQLDDYVDFITNSLRSSTIMNLNKVTVEDGEIEISQLQIPSGRHTIHFKIKAPSKDKLVIGPDLLTIPLALEFNLDSDNDDVCVSEAVSELTGEAFLPYCRDLACTQPPTAGNTLSTNVGISSFKNQITNWPKNVANGHLVLESSSKGMVLTRQKASDIPANKRVEGMIIYDTEDNCIKIYNGSSWHCIERKCNVVN